VADSKSLDKGFAALPQVATLRAFRSGFMRPLSPRSLANLPLDQELAASGPALLSRTCGVSDCKLRSTLR
jgi:hypothetical protein